MQGDINTKNLIRYMDKHHISRGDLAERTGIERGYIGRILNKRINPRMTTWVRIARGLDMSIHELVTMLYREERS